jgi:hypothetical protein
MADGGREFTVGADPAGHANRNSASHSVDQANNSAENAFYHALSEALRSEPNFDSVSELVQLSSGARNARETRLEAPVADQRPLANLEWRLPEPAPEGGAPGDADPSTFQAMVDRRLAQMGSGGDAGQNARAENWDSLTADSGDWTWDQLSTRATDYHDWALPGEPGTAFNEPGPRSSAVTMTDFQDHHDEMSFRYEQERQSSAFDVDVQTRYLDEGLKLLNEYGRNSAIPVNETRSFASEPAAFFEAVGQDALDEASLEPVEPLVQPQAQDNQQNAGSSPTIAEADAPAESEIAPGSSIPVSADTIEDIDLPDGFDNVGAFELI